jgi:hypothetical protein
MAAKKKVLLSVTVAIAALSITSADAREQRRTVNARVQSIGSSFAYDSGIPPNYISRGDGVGYRGTGTFSDGREVPGTNWNPNAN